MSLFSFPKSQRLLKSLDFDYLKSGAKTYKALTCLIYAKKSRIDSEYTRLGFAVSKKVASATVRNRLKRILREEFRKSAFKTLSLDLLLVVSNRRGKIDEKLLKDEFLKLLSQLKK